MHPLVSAAWLREHMHDAALAIADCRFDLRNVDRGRQAYAEAHVPGAVYFDLDRDLSSAPGAHGGRHPLPEPAELAAKLCRRGIGDESVVVCYDEDGTYAPRLWWLLRYLGHDGVAVLDGGIGAWTRAGGELTQELPHPRPVTFTPSVRAHMRADVGEIKRLSAGTALIDARAAVRYRGEVEPLDARAGHIPGSLSLPWKHGLAPDGRWRDAEAISSMFADVLERPVVSSCGSGVTACCNLLALAAIGKWDARLYAGSFSDWISYPDHAVRTGEQP